jgi:glycosyltransferase involved in cell wall biosynthesis
MKIGIEAQRIFRKKKHGMDIVALQLIRHLQQTDFVNNYFIFVKDDEDRDAIQESEHVKIVVIESAPYPYWEQVLLPRKVKETQVDLLHCTSNTAPLFISVPLIVTIHDIIYLETVNLTKGTSYQILGNLYRRWNVPRVVKKCAGVITVSDFERNKIIEHFDLPSDRVCTVYNGVASHFKPVDSEEERQLIKQRYNLPDKFIFYLGNTDPKKNMTGVIKTLSILRRNNKLSLPLVMLDIDREYLHEAAKVAGDVDVLNYITFCGYVPNHDLPAIYSMATIFLYPSLRESFGIPILEAMACATPVITSSTSSMPEVAGDAAVFADPSDPSDIAEKITQLLSDEKWQQELISKGLTRCRQFSWTSNAMKTLALYHDWGNRPETS